MWTVQCYEVAVFISLGICFLFCISLLPINPPHCSFLSPAFPSASCGPQDKGAQSPPHLDSALLAASALISPQTPGPHLDTHLCTRCSLQCMDNFLLHFLGLNLPITSSSPHYVSPFSLFLLTHIARSPYR